MFLKLWFGNKKSGLKFILSFVYCRVDGVSIGEVFGVGKC